MVLKKVAFYIRVSTEDQVVNGFSLDAQREELHAYCRKRDLVVAQIYMDEGISAKNIHDRPGLSKLLEDASKRLFDTVLVWKVSRLARNLKDLLYIEDLFCKSGVGLKSITEMFDTSNAYGKMSFQFLGGVSQLERETIKENTRLGRIRKNRQGIYCGSPIFGYNVIPVEVFKHEELPSNLVICKDEAEIVKMIFNLYVKGLGYKAILNLLNQEGIRSKHGKPFSTATIRKILTNVVYVGMIKFHEENEAAIVQGIHEPIISKKLWNSVQLRLQSNQKARPKKSRKRLLLEGYLKCPQCGGSMIGRTFKRKRQSGQYKEYSYYTCVRYANCGGSVCRPNLINSCQIEETVLKALRDCLNRENVVKDLYVHLNEDLIVSKDNPEKEVNLLMEEKALKKELSDLMERFENDEVNESDFILKLDKLKNEITKIKLLLEEPIIEHTKPLKPSISIGEIRDYLMDINVFLDMVNPTEKDIFIKSLIGKIELNAEKELKQIELHVFNQTITIL
jgi:site-specific DNA recombinase